VSAPPGKWTEAEVIADVAAAVIAFRQKRFAEPRNAWLREVDRGSTEFSALFDAHAVARPHELRPEDIPGIIDAGLLDALRYLTSPPISADDLKNLADVDHLTAQRLRDDPEAAKRVLDTIIATVDPRRFPWLAENRDPTESERAVAIFASALLHAAQRVQSVRRNDAKAEQELAVRNHLKSCGFAGSKLRRIRLYADFPSRGVVSENEVVFGGKKADLVSRLWDDRMLPIECKVSNSAVNSFKRLNHETVSKAVSWTDSFGTANVVPSAVLSGVFSTANVLSAQAAGVVIFWSHRIADLGDFVESTKNETR
jgi:hypothetical protein